MIKPIVSSQNISAETIKYALLCSNKILKYYKHLIDAYVLDFFTCSHWDKLSTSWKLFFLEISTEELQLFLNFKKHNFRQVMPLEIMCLRVLIQYLSIPRQWQDDKLKNAISPINNMTIMPASIVDPVDMKMSNKIQNLLWKHIKAKKRHEIKLFAQVIYETSRKTNCSYVVDIGSGLGHLDRLLSYGYSLKVCGIECNQQLTIQARKLDETFETQVAKYDRNFLTTKHTPIHINYVIVPSIDGEEFIKLIKNAFKDAKSFGIVGLHTCGDLGPTLLKLYRNCPNIKFINIVGCCYMKMTSSGYPLSDLSLDNDFNLSYNAREIACHALESYIAKLKSGQHWQLKIHSYRATLEYLIVQQFPELKHKALANVKYRPDMSFSDYCSDALKPLNIKLSPDSINSNGTQVFLDQWRLVVTFYSIRLLFAPLIESTILLDRYLYLDDSARDRECYLITVFDPLLSPRNHVLLGTKKEEANL